METATKGETPTDLKAVENATKVEPPVHRVGGKDTNTHRVGEEAIKVGVSVGFLGVEEVTALEVLGEAVEVIEAEVPVKVLEVEGVLEVSSANQARASFQRAN